MTLRLAVTPMHDILNQLKRFFPGLIHENVRVYFRDVFDHVHRYAEMVDAFREVLAFSFEASLLLESSRQNEITRRLAGHLPACLSPAS